MIAITVWQPWASLIIAGHKPFEFRTKSYLAYRPVHPMAGDRIVIHAGMRKVNRNEVADLLLRLESGTTGLHKDAREFLEKIHTSPTCIPLGAGLGTVALGKVHRVGGIMRGIRDSDRVDKSLQAWPMLNIRRWEPYVPCPGRQGFWKWPFAIKEGDR